MEQVTMQALGLAGAFAAVGLSAVGSALGTGAAGAATIGAWKKCYATNKPAPFLLMAFAGAPISQTIYGLVLMFSIISKAQASPESWITYLAVGILAGLGMGYSAWFQGKAGAGASPAFAETEQGFVNYLTVLGIIETVAIFVLVLAMVLLGKIA